MKMILLTVVLALLGCGKKTDETKTSASACDPIKKGVAALPGGSDVKSRLEELLVRRCTEDKWPAEVIACYEKADKQPAMRACREKLPPAERDRLIAEIQKVMALGGGLQRPAGHGAGSGETVKVPDGMKVPVSDPSGKGSGSSK